MECKLITGTFFYGQLNFPPCVLYVALGNSTYKNKCLPILRIIPNTNNLVERIRISINPCLYDLVLFRNELKDSEIEIPMMNMNHGNTKSVIVNPIVK